jgi:hypothetical protein
VGDFPKGKVVPASAAATLALAAVISAERDEYRGDADFFDML